MAGNDIEIKLKAFLDKYKMFTEEMHVVYLMVEMRKLIEHGGTRASSNYQTIKFYCDWALHTEKSRSFGGMETTFADIYRDCRRHLNGEDIVAQKLVDFAYFNELKNQMNHFFEEHGFDKHILEDQAAWVQFFRELLGVLTDQPINNVPNDDIEKILVSGVNEVAATIVVEFTSPLITPDGISHPSYELTNVLQGFSF